jgi:hypothetical protein
MEARGVGMPFDAGVRKAIEKIEHSLEAVKLGHMAINVQLQFRFRRLDTLQDCAHLNTPDLWVLPLRVSPAP